MIANFFQALEHAKVEWLLVSGQATILYGAATFSEDVDIWVTPTATNLARLESALAASQARYYKLTPPLTVHFAERHHGFHFVLPDEAGHDLFLDVMACPPRVTSFDIAKSRAQIFDTPWGRLPTVGIIDLVEFKKTQRARDYPIISRLALCFLEQCSDEPSGAALSWAAENLFALSEFKRAMLQFPSLAAAFQHLGDIPGRAAHCVVRQGDLTADLEDELDAWFEASMAPLRRADRHFWRAVIDELRELRAGGGLVAEGTSVAVAI